MGIRLTSEQVDAIHRASAPLQPAQRQSFIAEVAGALEGVPVIGDGVLHRIVTDIQRRHYDPPQYATGLSTPRWSR